MTEKDYPEEIYPEFDGVLRGASIYDLERAYEIGLYHGKEQTDQLAGFSNLTQAIQDGTRIDWERLDGLKAKCVHPELDTLTYKMERDKSRDLESHEGWWCPYSFQRAWVEAFTCGWRGDKGWSLWIECEIPVKKRTAEELEPGICFHGELQGVEGSFFIFINNFGTKRAYSLIHSDIFEPEKVEVVEVYGIGTLQSHKKEEN